MLDDLVTAKTDQGPEQGPAAQDGGAAGPHLDTPADAVVRAALSEWQLIETRRAETYSWPQGIEEFSSFDIYEATDPSLGRYGLAKVDMGANDYWGGRRPYFVVFRLGGGGGSKQPIVVFVAADDHEMTREYLAVIRGAGGERGQRMFGADDLPSVYDRFQVVTFRDRIAGTAKFRGYNRAAVLAHERDPQTMLRHGAIQVALRHDQPVQKGAGS